MLQRFWKFCFLAILWPKSGGHIGFLAINWPKSIIFNRYTKFVECHTGKVHSSFQVLSMFAVQMNVTFMSFQYHNLKVTCETGFCGYCISKRIIIQAKNNIYSCRFLQLLHPYDILKIIYTCFWTPQIPGTPLWP